MQFTRQFLAVPTAQFALLICACGTFSAMPAQADAQEAETSNVSENRETLNRWHEIIKDSQTDELGCFKLVFPQTRWEKSSCEVRTPNHGQLLSELLTLADSSRHKVEVHREFSVNSVSANTVGNRNDYVAQTAGHTWYAVGTFGTVTNVTSEKSVGGSGGILGQNKYMLQLNSQFGTSAQVCNGFGYSAGCVLWQQFFYAIGGPHSNGQGTDTTNAYMQYWVFPSRADYGNTGNRCPSGWYDVTQSSGYPACYRNSPAILAPTVPPNELHSLKLSAAAARGNSTVTFTYSGNAYAVTYPDILHLAEWWRATEFNVVGDLGLSQAQFNSAASITINLSVQDYTANPPACLNNGTATTGETNNLYLGTCKTLGGSTPSITFTESN